MTHNESLERRLAEMFDGHAWHGPPLLATLRDLTPAQAAATPIAGAHSIWALALHIDTWQRVVTRRLAGDDSPVGDAENFPDVPPPDLAQEARNRGHLFVENIVAKRLGAPKIRARLRKANFQRPDPTVDARNRTARHQKRGRPAYVKRPANRRFSGLHHGADLPSSG